MPATDTIFEIMFHPFAMMWYGQAMHVVKNLRDRELSGKPIGLRGYLKAHPFASLFSLLAGFAAYGLMYSTGQLTQAGALTAGYMADSVVNAFTNRELRRIEAQQ